MRFVKNTSVILLIFLCGCMTDKEYSCFMPLNKKINLNDETIVFSNFNICETGKYDIGIAIQSNESGITALIEDLDKLSKFKNPHQENWLYVEIKSLNDEDKYMYEFSQIRRTSYNSLTVFTTSTDPVKLTSGEYSILAKSNGKFGILKSNLTFIYLSKTYQGK
jgi:hypothetical protein